MSEIFNLNTLCRCCHSDGMYKSLELSYTYGGCFEVYSKMLQEALNITLNPPSINASYSICEDCIVQLRNAFQFKRKILECEQKFEEFCKNEQTTINVKDEMFDCSDGCDGDKVNHDDKPDRDYYNEDKFDLKVDIVHDNGNGNINNNSDIKDEGKVKKHLKGTTSNLDPELEVLVSNEDGSCYACKICGESFESRKLLRHHAHKYHRDAKHENCAACKRRQRGEEFQCDMCEKRFKLKQVLKKHVLWHSGRNRKCICEVCGKWFNDTTNLNVHIRIVHLKLRPFGCTLCPKTFTAKKNLKIHLRKHTGERPFACESCEKTYTAYSQLKRHRATHDDRVDQDGGYACKMCFQRFPTRGSLKAHTKCNVDCDNVKTASRQRHECHLCAKNFASRYTLNRHIGAHTGNKPFECDVCHTKFTQMPTLLRHKVRFHNPSRTIREKVKCDLCNLHVRDMEKHMRTHNQRPFQCEICSKTYPERNTLNRHVKCVHEGLKTFACGVCDKKFARKFTLENHSIKVHKIKLKEETEK